MNNNDRDFDRARHHDDDDAANRDPITGTPGSHPVGTAAGAAAAGTAGAVVGGAVGGPVGAVVGGALGAAVGGAVGHNAAEAANPTYVAVEPTLRDTFATRPYAQGRQYEDFQDAYAFGTAERARLGQPWSDEFDAELRDRWTAYPTSRAERLDWDTARPAVRDAFEASDRADISSRSS